ncbi:MAG: tetratricopeptide repeat protein [Treponema sp.]|nr:tetratricopeptide repeat protein [Treponema sp.]
MRKRALLFCFFFVFCLFSHFQTALADSAVSSNAESIESLEQELAEIPETDYGRRLSILGKLLTLYGTNEANAYQAGPFLEEAISIMERFFEPTSDVMVSMYRGGIEIFAMLQDSKKTLVYFEKYVHATGSDEIEFGKTEAAISFYSVVGMGYYENGKYDDAIRYFQKSASICETTGAKADCAKNYNSISGCYNSKTDYENALLYGQKSLALYQELYGKNTPQTLEPLVNIGNIYLAKADFKTALQLYEQALDLQKKGAIEENAITASLYNNIGLAYEDMTDYKNALHYLEKSLELRKKLFGEEHTEVAASYSNIGMVYYQNGDFDRALSYFFKALSLREKLFAVHPETAASYQNVALVYSEKNDYETALTYYEKARNMLVSLVGETHENVAMVYSNISRLYQEKDDYQNAVFYGDKALSIRKTMFGETHPQVATSYMNKGLLYRTFGDYDNAVFYIEKALAVYTAVYGEWNPNIATAYNNLGVIFEDKGQLDTALNYFQKALSMRIDLFGENNIVVSMSYLGIGNVYGAKGDCDNALSYYERARIICEQTVGTKHSHTALVYNNIAMVYQQKESYGEAIRSYKKALDVYLSIYGESHTMTAMAYSNLGTTYRDKKDYDIALRYLNKAKSIREQLLGENHPDTASVYVDIALVCASKNDYENAFLYNEKALAVYEKTFGSEHPHTALIYFNMGLYYHIKKNTERASEYWAKSVHASKNISNYVDTIERMKKIIRFSTDDGLVKSALETGIEATERARLDLTSIKTDLLQQSLPLYYQGVAFEAAHNNVEKAFEYSESLRNRGFLDQLGFETALKLDGITEKERTDVRTFSQEIAQARKEIATQNELGEKRSNEKLVRAGERLAKAEHELEILDSRLSERIPAYAQLRSPKTATAKDTQAWCGIQRVILEYIVWQNMSYCFVIQSNGIHIVPIDSEYDYALAATELRNAVFKKRQSLFSGKKASIQKYRSELYAKLIAPVRPYFTDGTKRILIVPDGALSSIPFDILGNEHEGVLCEKYALSFSPSVSVSMLREKKTASSFKMLGIGNAVYESAEPATQGKTSAVSDYYKKTVRSWENIPGTALELKNIKNMIRKNEHISVYEGKNSTEALVKKLSHSGDLANYSQILFACHGYFNSDEPEFSSLVFSEVSGTVSASDDDGYLTVSELAVLNMNADFLNLSACQTGLSEQRQGDGMVGLTRSCIVAGANNVGVTLWEVDDNATCEFQRIFYTHIKNGYSYESAYQSAKQEMKNSEQWSDPVYWAAFVLYE